MAVIENYEEQVYAGVLGKVIGVYMGRPFEGWTKERLEARWHRVDRYVHEDQQVPLVVEDDDISGTFTFIRALEDSGLYAETSAEFIGDTWLNYLIPLRSVLWWGGLGVSTEHTAYLRLKSGLKAPHSGSIATNGPLVAQQIGAQIFIDAFGMVAPGQPELAAKLARRAASVSHDGEAINAAVVVAGMIAAAFVEKDMQRLLDIGAGLIPPDSLIAKLHRDVRAWAAGDGDWRRTYERIAQQYGYAKYGGGCHVVPNHALMVMAWAYAPDDFHAAQVIINTAGWDTDCNAANVGALMGVKVGLGRINEKYDFQSPFADRLLLPTAEGTRAVSDVLSEALRVAAIGRKIMGWPQYAAPKGGAWHHFAMPGAQHGYLPESVSFETRGAAQLTNVPGHAAAGQRSLQIAFRVGPGRIARVSTPIYPCRTQEGNSSYHFVGTPRLYPGNGVLMTAVAGALQGSARARLFVRSGRLPDLAYGEPVTLQAGKPVRLSLTVPDTQGWPVQDFGIELNAELPAHGEIFIDQVELRGAPGFSLPGALFPCADQHVHGWIKHLDQLWAPAPELALDAEARIRLTKNEGRGVLITGTTDWHDYRVSAGIAVRIAEGAGLIIRYQGLERYLAVLKTRDALRLVSRYYGETLLDETPCRWASDALHTLQFEAVGDNIVVRCDGEQVLQGRDDKLGAGGAGFVLEAGTMLCRDFAVEALA